MCVCVHVRVCACASVSVCAFTNRVTRAQHTIWTLPEPFNNKDDCVNIGLVDPFKLVLHISVCARTEDSLTWICYSPAP